MENDKLEKIKKHFKNLKECHDWCHQRFPDALGLAGKYLEEDKIKLEEKILPAVEREYEQLALLGVSKTFSASLFVFGAEVTRSLVEQFNSQKPL